MTGLIGRLEADGLVRKTADPADARAVRVELTAHGREQLAAVRAERASVLQARLDQLDDDARAALAAALPALDRLIAV
jgi:DNA-binding MarR family transcriptional regulator